MVCSVPVEGVEAKCRVNKGGYVRGYAREREGAGLRGKQKILRRRQKILRGKKKAVREKRIISHCPASHLRERRGAAQKLFLLKLLGWAGKFEPPRAVQA